MTTQVSRRDTTARKVGYLGQLSLGAQPGRAAWTRAALALRVAESRPDRALVASIVRERHYLQRAAVPPRGMLVQLRWPRWRSCRATSPRWRRWGWRSTRRCHSCVAGVRTTSAPRG